MKLAIDGGPKAKKTPYGSGRIHGGREIELLGEVIGDDDLFYFGGKKTDELRRRLCGCFGRRFCALASSGSAAVHAALASCEIEPGYEVITSPITDLGSVIGIVYQNLIPVFADVDPHTYNITADTIAKALTDRTRAVIVVHLAGNPAEIDDIIDLCRERNVAVIEDAAQSCNALHRGRKAGATAPLGCFSFNATKHMNAGEGGFVVTNDEELFFRCHNFIDKYYDRHNRGVRLSAVAPNYRVTELQSAVALAQLEKLDEVTATRTRHGDRLTGLISGCPCLTPHLVHPHNVSSYWFYLFRLIPGRLAVSRERFVEALVAEGVPAQAGYIPRPVYLERAFVDKSFFPGGVWPAEVVAGRKYAYETGMCPVAEEVLATAVKLPISEFFTDNDIEETGEAVRKVGEAYTV